MGKGSAPAGNTTTTQVNPTAQAQLPYLQDIFGTAQDIYRSNPPSPLLQQGYQQLAGISQAFDPFRGAANDPFYNAARGQYGVQNSPAYGGYQSFATGQAAPQQAYNALQSAAQAPNTGTTALAGQSSYNNPAVSQLLAQNPGTQALAGAAQGQGFGLNALRNTASGANLNGNPYLDATFQNAADRVGRVYQTVTAPTTDAAFSGGARYGSGAAAGARDTNERNLGQALSGLATDVYGQNYARERQAQDAAAGNYQTLINQAGTQYGQLSNQAAGTAGQLINQAASQYGNLTDQGLRTALAAAGAQAAGQQYGITGLQGGYNAGNEAALRASGMYPQLAQAQLLGPQALVQAGQGLTDAPWAALNQYRQAVGAGYSGSANTTSPYFQNPTANALAGISGGLGIANQLGGGSGGLGGLGGLLGGGGGSAGYNAIANAGLTDFGGGGAALGIADTAFAPVLSAADYALPVLGGVGAAAPAAWIICTELTRQGRMPKRHYLAGISLFASYPERTKRGYYCWSIPAVRHLRRYPNSRRSKFLAAIACWRSENIAAKRGVRGARRLVRGMLVSAVGYPLCVMLGYFVAPQDWRSVYE